MNPIQPLLHIIAASSLGYSIYYDVTAIHFPKEFLKLHVEFAGRFKYLTFLNALLQLTFYIVAVLNDVVGTNAKTVQGRHSLQKCRDFLFSSLVFPLAMFVSVSFWTLWAIDRELVFPESMDKFFPLWLNHMLHSSIMPFALAEMFIVAKVYPPRSKSMKVISAWMIGYIAWVLFIAYHTQYWVYPVLEILSWPYRILFMAGCALVGCVFYLLGEKLHFLIWGKETSSSTKGVAGKGNGRRQVKRD